MIGKNEPTDELNLEILFFVDIFSPVSILEPLFLGISLLAQELIEPKMFRPDRMIVLFRIFGRWLQIFSCLASYCASGGL